MGEDLAAFRAEFIGLVEDLGDPSLLIHRRQRNLNLPHMFRSCPHEGTADSRDGVHERSVETVAQQKMTQVVGVYLGMSKHNPFTGGDLSVAELFAYSASPPNMRDYLRYQDVVGCNNLLGRSDFGAQNKLGTPAIVRSNAIKLESLVGEA
ncbi:hypothetical protein L3i23_13270 [Herbiconiux sp. L3-i23]|nr:hypothetical protein L3i23_13270 [Herbiconiux sp. L3-i23]